ncbi:hypothetical protein [Pseudomonas sp. PP3]|uniref:hypothetical protein n=1 Tax=Pseudomonas sp. PP3 TaxID=2815936 RepID=UPI001BB00CD0|nr:hypothetical protein [Pseudomonas sp. PP3]
MRLDQVELNALRHLFGNEPSMSALNADEVTCIVIERALTSVGFYSIIKFTDAREVEPSTEVSKNFKHPCLKKGGAYVCWVNQDLTFCLEGFSKESAWPRALTPLALQ